MLRPLKPLRPLLSTDEPEEDVAITPEQEQSVLESLGSAGLSTLGYIGRYLDSIFGGRAIRGALGGKPRELLSLLNTATTPILPGVLWTDMLGITNPQDVVFGKDILKWDDPNSWMDDIAGFGVELATDPSTYLSFGLLGGAKGAVGAATKGGQIASKMGLTRSPTLLKQAQALGGRFAKMGPRELAMEMKVGDLLTDVGKRADSVLPGGASPVIQAGETIAPKANRKLLKEFVKKAREEGANPRELLNQNIGTFVGYGLPFTTPRPMRVPGDLLAARYFDKAGQMWGNSIVGRSLKAAFKAPVLKAKTRLVQEVAEQASEMDVQHGEKARRPVGVTIENAHDDLAVRQERGGYEAGDTVRMDPETAATLKLTPEAAVGHVVKVDPSTGTATVAYDAGRPAMVYDNNAKTWNQNQWWDTVDVPLDTLSQSHRISPLDAHVDRLSAEFKSTGSVTFPDPQNAGQAIIADYQTLTQQGARQPIQPRFAPWLDAQTESRIAPLYRQADQIKPANDALHAEAVARGASSTTLDDVVHHDARYPHGLEHLTQDARAAAYKNVYGTVASKLGDNFVLNGTEFINKVIWRDEFLLNPGNSFNAKVAYLMRAYGPGHYVSSGLASGTAQLPPMPALTRAHAEKIVSTMDSMTAAQKSQGLFPHMPQLDRMASVERRMDKLKKNKVIAESIARAAKSAEPNSQVPKGMVEPVPVRDVIASRYLGNSQQGFYRYLAKKMGIDVDAYIARRVASAPQGFGSISTSQAMDAAWTALTRQIDEMFIPKDVADDLTEIMKKAAIHETPIPLRMLDSYSTLWKAGHLTHPARHVRDLASGLVDSALMGRLSIKSAIEGWKLATGKAGKSPVDAQSLHSMLRAAGLDPSKATAKQAERALRETFVAVGMTPAREGRIVESLPGTSINRGEDVVTDFLDLPPQRAPVTRGTLWNEAKRAGTKAGWNPFHHSGSIDWWSPHWDVHKNTGFWWWRAGNEMTRLTDAVTRYAPMMELMRQGYTPAVAKRLVTERMVDFSPLALTKFERDVMSRIFPFYRYTKGIVKPTVEVLANAPGSPLAQAYRFPYHATQTESGKVLPEHVAATVALPIPGAPDGRQRYLTGFGLMGEGALGMLRPGSTSFESVQKSAAGVASQMNPVAKMLMEIAGNRQLYTGRDVEEVQSVLGRIGHGLGISHRDPNLPILADYLVGNLPTARYTNTLATILEENPQKPALSRALHTLTGVRMADVDFQNRKNMLIRLELEDLLAGRRGIQTFQHLFSSDPSILAEEDRVLLEVYKRHANRQLKESRARKKLAEQK